MARPDAPGSHGDSGAGSPRSGLWQRIDGAAFGLIYGAVTVLALLMAMGAHPSGPLEMAVVLFGSVLAITLAKAFAEVMSGAIDSGTKIKGTAIAGAWHHARPTLVAANVPAAALLAAHAGWWSVDTAIAAAQVYCVALLMLIGLRTGWVVDQRPLPAVLAMILAGAVGVALAGMKYILH
ncbi:MAG: hypothetical protein KDK26_03420 [Roseivivax sp.]|nr:hypothetical protein [Roseivivax sp.]